MNKFVSFLKKRDIYLGISRYILGLYMFPFGISKILRTQFVILPVHTWQKSLENLSGVALAWAFLGYSSWFQVLLGVLELVPAILLLFRRTTLLGAILLLPMTLNVFLINQALDLWSSTKQSSSVLLLLNILVLIFEWRNIKSILLVIFNKERKLKLTIWEISINAVIISVISFLLASNLFEYIGQKDELTGDWYNKHPNEWILQSEKINDSLLPARIQKSYFGAYGSYEEINDSGINKQYKQYAIDKKKRTLEFNNHDDSTVKVFTYTLIGDSLIRMQRIVDGSKNIQLTQVFRKRIIHAKGK